MQRMAHRKSCNIQNRCWLKIPKSAVKGRRARSNWIGQGAQQTDPRCTLLESCRVKDKTERNQPQEGYPARKAQEPLKKKHQPPCSARSRCCSAEDAAEISAFSRRAQLAAENQYMRQPAFFARCSLSMYVYINDRPAGTAANLLALRPCLGPGRKADKFVFFACLSYPSEFGAAIASGLNANQMKSECRCKRESVGTVTNCLNSELFIER